MRFVLDALGRPAGEGLEAGLELLVLILNFDGFPPLGLADTSEGQTAFLRLVGPGLLDDFRVEHDHISAFIVKDDDALVHANHVGCHTYAAVLVGGEGVQQILGDGQVFRYGGLGFLC